MSAYEYDQIKKRLDRIERKEDALQVAVGHNHELLHALADAVAAIVPAPGGMSLDESKAIAQTLRDTAAKLRSKTSPAKTPAPENDDG